MREAVGIRSAASRTPAREAERSAPAGRSGNAGTGTSTAAPHQQASTPLADTSRLEKADDVPSHGGRHHFFSRAILIDSTSRAYCATSDRNLRFSSSSRRFSWTSGTLIPLYLARQRCTVCTLTPSRRETSVCVAPPSIGVTTFLIRGFDPLEDAIDYGRELIPRVREATAGCAVDRVA
jgi:hypothetical protein